MSNQPTTIQTNDTDTETHDWDDRIGNKMRRGVRAVHKEEAYPSKRQLALLVGPHRSTDYGYQIVDRCIRRGLLEVDESHDKATYNARGAVVLTDNGRAYYQHITGGGEL